MKTKILLVAVSMLFASYANAQAGECGPTKVVSVDVNQNGAAWLKFANKTQFAMKPENDPGFDNTLSVALAAFAMDADVRIDLGDMSQCAKGGNATSWKYLKLTK